MMATEEYISGNGDSSRCCCCVNSPSIQVYGFYLCKSCDEMKRVISYEENGALQVHLQIGTVYVSGRES